MASSGQPLNDPEAAVAMREAGHIPRETTVPEPQRLIADSGLQMLNYDIEQSQSKSLELTHGMDAGALAWNSEGNRSYSSTSTSAEGDEKCRLLRLPAEIQNRIFECAVVQQEPIDVTVHIRNRDSKFYWQLQPCEPPLAAACKFVRKVARPIYYGQNTFRFEGHGCHDTALAVWNKRVGEQSQYLHHLQAVTYRLDHGSPHRHTIAELHADLALNGAIRLSRTVSSTLSGGVYVEDVCTCDPQGLPPALAGDGKDGNVLVRLAVDYLVHANHKEEMRYCEKCKLQRLYGQGGRQGKKQAQTETSLAGLLVCLVVAFAGLVLACVLLFE